MTNSSITPAVGERRPMAHQSTARQPLITVRRGAGRLLTYVVLIVFTAVLLFPVYWLASGSLKTPDAIAAYPVIWFPSPLAWGNYSTLFQSLPMGTYFFNTLFVAVCATIGTTFSSAIVGYSFARLRFPGRNALFVLALSTLMVPSFVTLIPQFVMFKSFGWLDTFAPLIVPQLFANPAYLFLTRQFFLTQPRELEDAAKIDGCGYVRTFWSIALPLIKPALIAVALFTFLYNWNDFLGPLIYLQSSDHLTLQLGLAQLQSQYSTHFELIMVGAVVSTLPVIALFFIGQRWFIQGIVVTGVKG